MDKYKQYVDIHWWDGVEKREIENWFKNFSSNTEVAKLILDNVMFYNSKQMKAYTRYLVNNLKNEVYMKIMEKNEYHYVEDHDLEFEWENYLETTQFMPAAIPDDTASSAYKIIRYWRASLNGTGNNYSSIDNFGNAYSNGKKRFVLVDDFSGSGKQIIKVLQHEVDIEGKKIQVGKLPEVYSDIEIIIAVYVMHEKAQANINSHFRQVKIMAVDYITEDFNYLNDNSIFYKDASFDEKRKIISDIKTIMDRIKNESSELKELDSYVLNIPVVFEHGCPNNTLVLLFAHSDSWQQLFKRGKEL